MAHKYYLHSSGDTSTDDANTLHTSAVNDLTAGSGRSFGTATTIATGSLGAGATVQWVHFTTESSGQAAGLTHKGSWPGQETWPTGTYNCIVNVTAAGGELTYGATDLGSGVGHFARVNRAADAHVGSTTTGGSATGTGIKTFTASAWATSVPTGSWDDRLEVVIACTRAAGGHGNQSASMQVSSNEASDANGGVINTPHSNTTPALAGPTISRVGTTTHTYVENNNTITGSYPAGVAADDIVIVSVSNEDATADWTTVPAGYTLRGRHTAGEEVMSTYYKILTGSDAALTFVANLGSPQDQSIIVTAYRGIDLTTPFDIADVIANGRVDVNFTPVTADSVMVAHMAKDVGFTRNNMTPTRVIDNPHLYPDGGTHATTASLQITQAFDRDIATAVASVFSAHRESSSDLKTRVMVLRPGAGDNRTGTITATQEPDVGDFAGTHTAPAFTGTIAATQDPNTSTFTGKIGQVGTIAATQDGDTGEFTGTFTNVYTGTIDGVQADDTADFTGTVVAPAFTGTIAVTQANNTGSFTGTFTPAPITGSVSPTQDDNTSDFAATFTPTYTGTIAATQTDDTADLTGTVVPPAFTGTVDANQDNQTSNFVGETTPPAFTGTISATRENDTGLFTGTFAIPAVTGTIDADQTDDTANFTGNVVSAGFAGSIAGVQDPNLGEFTGTVINIYTGTVDASQDDDITDLTGTVTPPAFVGSITSTQDDNAGSFTGTFTPEPRTGTIASTQDDNTALGLGIPVIRGTTTSKTSGTTISRVPTTALAVGNIVFVWCVSDNTTATDGYSNNHLSVTDTDGHTWTKIRERTEGGGGPSVGVTISLWATKVTSEIKNPDTVTLTLSEARTAKVLGLFDVTVGSGNTFSVPSENSIGTNGTGTTPTASISGLPSIDRLWMGFFGWEGPSTDDYTQDPDYLQSPFKSISDNGTTGGVDASNVTGSISAVRSNQTGDTYAPTLPVSRDWAVILAAIEADTRVFTAIFTPPPITGTISATQNDDAGSFTGNVVAPNFTGTIAGTQSDDLGDFTGTAVAPAFTGTIAGTQDPDTANFTGTVVAPNFTGTITTTQDDDTGDFAGTHTAPAFTGTIDGTQDDNTSTISGTHTPPAVTGTLDGAQADDTGSLTGTVGQSGTIGAVQDDQTGTLTGEHVPPAVTGTIDGAQDSQTGEFTGTVGQVGTIASIQEDQTGDFDAVHVPPAFTGTISSIQDDDTGAFTGTFTAAAFTGTILATEEDDTANFVGEVVAANFTGTIDTTQDDNTGAFTGTFTPAPITGTIASTQDDNTSDISATFTPASITGIISGTQQENGGEFAGTFTLNFTGDIDAAQDDNTSNFIGEVVAAGFTGTITSTQDGDVASFAGTYTPAPITGVISVTQDDNTIVASGTFTPEPRTGTISGTQDPNTGAFTATHTPPAFSGVIASTQADDDIDITGVIVNFYTGIIVVTQDNDIANFSGQGAEAITGILRKGRSFDARNRDLTPVGRDFHPSDRDFD